MDKEEELSDTESKSSNVSYSTDLKVFNGAIHKQKNILDSYINKMKEKNKTNQEIKNKLMSSPHLSKINIEASGHLQNKTPNKKNNKMNTIETKKTLNFFKTNRIILPKADYKKYSRKIEKDNNIKVLENTELLSFRNTNDINSNQNEIFKDDNITNNNPQVVLKFKETTKEDVELLQNDFIPNNYDDIIDKTDKAFSSSITYFTISSIERGYALVVNSDDIIFTLPISMLPKNVEKGDCFSFEFEETNQSMVTRNKLALMQRAYLRDYLK